MVTVNQKAFKRDGPAEREGVAARHWPVALRTWVTLSFLKK